jgi:anti-anti-sigma factor
MEQVQPWPVVRALGRIVVTPSGAVDAVAATRLRSLLADLIEGQGNLEVVVDAMYVASIDETAVKVLREATRRMGERGGTLVISSPRPEVRAMLEDSDVTVSPPGTPTAESRSDR